MSGRPAEPLRREPLERPSEGDSPFAESGQTPSDRTERLVRITSAIADAVTPSQVAEAVVDEVARAIGADTAGLWTVAHGSRAASLVRSVGYSPASIKNFANVSLDVVGKLPPIDAILRSEALFIASKEELLAQYPHLAADVRMGSYRIACVPIDVEGRVFGSLGFTFLGAGTFDEEERAFLKIVARHCGQALERLRLLEAEQSNRAIAEASARRMGVLSRASRVFAESSDNLPDLLQAIAEQLTAECVDGCSITLVSAEGGHLQRAAFVHRDPVASAEIRALFAGMPPTLGKGIAGRVLVTGETLFIPEVNVAELIETAAPLVRAWLEKHPPRSLVVVPLRARGRVLGSITAIREKGSPPLTPADVELIDELAQRAAMAVERSRLHEVNQLARLRAEMLFRLAGAVAESEKVEEVFDAALDTMQGALHALRVAVLVFDDDGVMRFRAWRGLSDDYRRAVEGHSPWTRDTKAAEPIVVPCIADDVSLARFADVFAAENIGALAFVPLLAGGRLIGKFMVYYDGATGLALFDGDLARAIARHVAAAIARFAAMHELQDTVRFNEMFTAILGHDLRNPLGGIMAGAQLALRRSEGDKLRKPLARIVSSAERMSRMIDQLLDFTRVRVGAGIPISTKRVDLDALIRLVIEELIDANPEWAFRVEVEGDPVGTWDEDRLAQVFSNLVGNAVQHGDRSAGVFVRVNGSAEHGVRVDVHNIGAVPTDLVSTLFEPMAGNNRRGDKSTGLGLGLFITQQITSAHGGTIEVRSTSESGTTISVFLPRIAANSPEIPSR